MNPGSKGKRKYKKQQNNFKQYGGFGRGAHLNSENNDHVFSKDTNKEERLHQSKMYNIDDFKKVPKETESYHNIQKFSTSKSYFPENWNVKGASKNKVSNKDNIYYCFTCKTWLYNYSAKHINHNLEMMDVAINSLEKLRCDSLQNSKVSLENSLNEICDSKEHVNISKEIIYSLENIFEQRSNDLNKFEKEGIELKLQTADLSVVCKTFADHVKVQSSSEVLKDKIINWSKSSCHTWLYSSWRKISLGILLDSSKGDVFLDGENGKYSKLTLEGDRIKFSSFQKCSLRPDDSSIPFQFIETFIKNCQIKIFMDISHNRNLGTLIIRPLIMNFWGKQFLYMCCGLLDNSYIGSSFHRSLYRGKEGHHIWGGDYSHGNGDGGRETLAGANISKEKFHYPINAGVISSRYGVDDFSTIFRIYIKESKDDVDPNSFAIVEDGLAVLHHIGNASNINDIKITEGGFILPLSN